MSIYSPFLSDIWEALVICGNLETVHRDGARQVNLFKKGSSNA